MKLVEISVSGAAAEGINRLPAVAADVGAAYVALYKSAGYVRPWLGYFALENSVCIGTCGFKGPPQHNRVEIAYFTFPEYERGAVPHGWHVRSSKWHSRSMPTWSLRRKHSRVRALRPPF